jgi:glycosyltransferase involved in cell wall biosynthesis
MTDRFDVFGPLADTLDNLGLSGPNIHYRGTVKDIADYDFADYDGFIFTSLYEGMPNIVLEMSQHAIPMVLTDVGGLRDTFDDQGAIFISHRASTAETAGAFGAALGRIIEMSPEETVTMVETARNQVAARHAPDQFLRRVTELFGI